MGVKRDDITHQYFRNHMMSEGPVNTVSSVISHPVDHGNIDGWRHD
jgi:hypothetical protein